MNNKQPLREAKQVIKDAYGVILGSIATDRNGDQVAYDFYGMIVGRYNAKLNTTYDKWGRIVSIGNTLSALIIKSK